MPKIKRRRVAIDEREDDIPEDIPVAANNAIMQNPRNVQLELPATRHLHPEEVKALINEFSGEYAVNPWLRKVEHYQRLYNWTDNATLLYASTRSARLWYISVEERIFTFHDFKTMIQATFPNYCDDADIHHELMAVVKKQQRELRKLRFPSAKHRKQSERRSDLPDKIHHQRVITR